MLVMNLQPKLIKDDKPAVLEIKTSTPSMENTSSDCESDESENIKQSRKSNKMKNKLLKVLLDAKDKNGQQMINLNDDAGDVP